MEVLAELIAGILLLIIRLLELIIPGVCIVFLIKLVSNKIPQKRKKTKIKEYQQKQEFSQWEYNQITETWEPKDKSRIIKDNNNTNAPNSPSGETDNNANLDFRNSYQKKYLFSKNELQQYKVLKQIADVKGYIICPKVRLLDIVEPRKGIKKYMTYFYKIQAKHVDFVICDQGMHIKAIIELDDGSHDSKERIERDKLVNEILWGVGYKVIHTRYITNDILDTV